ncbi:hypothetical protein GGR50DRAFT_199188 [Xylaria sp. CBS 124048]|nr:hypothetical protein GGR50DRAFT_199188 [Xylaria sp. CBS 124048]
MASPQSQLGLLEAGFQSLTLNPSPQVQSLFDAGLKSLTLAPFNARYKQREESYWSNTAKLRPACIVVPQSAQEVAAALKAIVRAGHKFAVRSGGHTSTAGSNNIKDGVTIDLSELNTVSYDAASGLANIGPGAVWRAVYKTLSSHGVTVAGGRAGDVGVGGLLLGGGKSFFTGGHGFACDNVVAYEIVLGSGDIITASQEQHMELFQALKGGNNNFGIVTRFTMNTIKCQEVWGGLALLTRETIPAVLSAIVNFTSNTRRDPDSNLVSIITHSPQTQGTSVVMYWAQVAGNAQSPAYHELRTIPQVMNTMEITSHQELADGFSLPAGLYNIWYTLTVKNDVRMMAEASRLHDELVDKLRTHMPDGNFTTQCVLQPLPKLYAERSEARGGNSLGLERHQQDGVLVLLTAMLRTQGQTEFAGPKMQEWFESLQAYGKQIDGLLPWVYLNYAHATQSPLASYGRESVERMRRVAREYDPQGVFQTLCPGGFKISNVRDEDVSP